MIVVGLQHLDQGVSVFDADLNLIVGNRRLGEMLELPNELILPGTSLKRIFEFNAARGEYGEGDPEEQVRSRMDRARAFEPHVFDRIRPDGTIIEIRGHPILGGGFISTYTDVTEKRRVDEALRGSYDEMESRVKERTKELREKTLLLETTLENITQGFSFFDKNLNLAVANKRFFELLDFPLTLNKYGTPLEKFFRYNAERGEYGEGDISTLVHERLELARNNSEHRFRRARKSGVVLEVSGKPLPDGGFVTTYSDVTEEEAGIVELREAKLSAEKANRSKSDFLANMSHELRTPLNAIIGFSEAVFLEIFGPLGNEKYGEYAHNIHDSGIHLLELINDILDVSVIEAGKLNLDYEDITVEDLASSTLRVVQSRASEKGLSLVDEISAGDTVLNVDARRIRQILLNLLTNAIKFTPKGGTVRLLTEKDEKDEFSFVVVDTGTGMDEEGIALALTPFGQVIEGKQITHEGVGLGIPLTKELIEAHGGQLEITSQLGNGTTIRAVLPKDRIVRLKRFPPI